MLCRLLQEVLCGGGSRASAKHRRPHSLPPAAAGGAAQLRVPRDGPREPRDARSAPRDRPGRTSRGEILGVASGGGSGWRDGGDVGRGGDASGLPEEKRGGRG